jgi:hypothetical protein
MWVALAISGAGFLFATVISLSGLIIVLTR